jgi:hypothetical protein
MKPYSNRLRTHIVIVIVLFLILISGSGYCEVTKDEIPPIIKSGLTAYKASGPEAAIIAWIKGSPFDGSKDAMSQANLFKQVETFYGKYLDYTPIAVINLTPTTKIIYLSMNFTSGPVFCKFLVYKIQVQGKDSWILSGKFNFHTEPEQVLPDGCFDIKK